MYRIEKIADNCFYIKTLGTFPPSVAERFKNDFNEKTKGMKNFCTIIDNLDAILLDIYSFNIILDILIKNNERLIRSAFVISKNPPLDSEFQLLIEKSTSPKRKIVRTLDEAKEWVGIEDIIIGRED